MDANTLKDLTAICGIDCFNCEFFHTNIDAFFATLSPERKAGFDARGMTAVHPTRSLASHSVSNPHRSRHRRGSAFQGPEGELAAIARALEHTGSLGIEHDPMRAAHVATVAALEGNRRKGELACLDRLLRRHWPLLTTPLSLRRCRRRHLRLPLSAHPILATPLVSKPHRGGRETLVRLLVPLLGSFYRCGVDRHTPRLLKVLHRLCGVRLLRDGRAGLGRDLRPAAGQGQAQGGWHHHGAQPKLQETLHSLSHFLFSHHIYLVMTATLVEPDELVSDSVHPLHGRRNRRPSINAPIFACARQVQPSHRCRGRR